MVAVRTLRVFRTHRLSDLKHDNRQLQIIDQVSQLLVFADADDGVMIKPVLLHEEWPGSLRSVRLHLIPYRQEALAVVRLVDLLGGEPRGQPLEINPNLK